MRENAAYVKPLQPLHIREDYREDGGKARFDVHPALYHVDFRTADESPYAVSTPVEHDAHFRRQPNAATKNETANPLWHGEVHLLKLVHELPCAPIRGI